MLITHTQPVAALSPRQLEAWSNLEARALEPNAYQSPHFVLPALTHLGQGARALVTHVRPSPEDDAPLLAALALQPSSGNRTLPWPHLAMHACVHSFLATPLVAGERATETVAALLDHLALRFPLAGGLIIDGIDAHGPVSDLLRAELKRRGLRLHAHRERERAWLQPVAGAGAALSQRLGRRLKDIDRQRRRLAELGTVTWQAHRTLPPAPHAGGTEHPVCAFLRLEHLGWKGSEGTSLRAHPAHEAFFRDLSHRFASHGRAFFTELHLDGQAIASTANFVSGNVGFAFKVGWDPAHRRFGPGILNEVELLRQADVACADLVAFDSGAEPGSFIDGLWPQRRTLMTVFVPLNRLGEQAWLAAAAARRLVRHRPLAGNGAREPQPGHTAGPRTPAAADTAEERPA